MNNQIQHNILKTNKIGNLTLHEIDRLDKKIIFSNNTNGSDGYHHYTSKWWHNLNCPYAYKYLHLDSLYPSHYFRPEIGHPNEVMCEQIYLYMQEIYRAVFNKNFYSIFEIGCGAGEITSQFKTHELDYMCVEGTDAGVSKLINIGIDANRIVKSDLRLFKGIEKKFDLVMCTEVAEHLEPSFSSKIVELCIQHSDVVWFSAAEPNAGTPHYHHPNEIPIEAWDNLFAFFGYNKFIALNNIHGRAKRLYLKGD